MRLLTSREWDVAQHVCAGLTNGEIALELGMEESTVRSHVHHISEKLGVMGRGRVGILLRLQELGEAIRPAAPEPEPEPERALSEPWKKYLAAFDRVLAADDREYAQRARDMAVMFEAAMIGEGREMPSRRRRYALGAGRKLSGLVRDAVFPAKGTRYAQSREEIVRRGARKTGMG